MHIYGEEFLDDLLEVNNEVGEIKMHSFILKSSNFRNSRSHQFISHAIYKAYEGILPREKHPIFFVFLYINPQRVDSNVHPTKREVRFENKDFVYSFVNSSIIEALKGERLQHTKQFFETFLLPQSTSYVQTYGVTEVPQSASFESVISENLEFPYKPQLPFIYIGDTLIALSGKGGLNLIDHHAADERILFEKFIKGINLNSTRLLFPKHIKLSPKAYQIILQNLHVLTDFGIEIDDFGHNTVIVRSLPDDLKNSDIEGILSDIASCIVEGTAPDKSLKESIVARIACHSSIRGKEILAQEELSRLISDLEHTENPDQCPHGRPTRIFFSLDDLKKCLRGNE